MSWSLSGALAVIPNAACPYANQLLHLGQVIVIAMTTEVNTPHPRNPFSIKETPCSTWRERRGDPLAAQCMPHEPLGFIG